MVQSEPIPSSFNRNGDLPVGSEEPIFRPMLPDTVGDGNADGAT